MFSGDFTCIIHNSTPIPPQQNRQHRRPWGECEKNRRNHQSRGTKSRWNCILHNYKCLCCLWGDLNSITKFSHTIMIICDDLRRIERTWKLVVAYCLCGHLLLQSISSSTIVHDGHEEAIETKTKYANEEDNFWDINLQPPANNWNSGDLNRSIVYWWLIGSTLSMCYTRGKQSSNWRDRGVLNDKTQDDYKL